MPIKFQKRFYGFFGLCLKISAEEKLSAVPTALLDCFVALDHGLKPMATRSAAPLELFETYILHLCMFTN